MGWSRDKKVIDYAMQMGCKTIGELARFVRARKVMMCR